VKLDVITFSAHPVQRDGESTTWQLTADHWKQARRLAVFVGDLPVYVRNTLWVKKTSHYTFVCNFDKCGPIFKILSVAESVVNLQQSHYENVHKFTFEGLKN